MATIISIAEIRDREDRQVISGALSFFLDSLPQSKIRLTGEQEDGDMNYTYVLGREVKRKLDDSLASPVEQWATFSGDEAVGLLAILRGIIDDYPLVVLQAVQKTRLQALTVDQIRDRLNRARRSLQAALDSYR